MYTKLNDVVFIFMGYKLPWVLQYLDKEKMGICYPVVLAAVLNCHKSIRIMIQYHS